MNNSEKIDIPRIYDVIRDKDGNQCCAIKLGINHRFCDFLRERFRVYGESPEMACEEDGLPVDSSDWNSSYHVIRPHDKCIIRQRLIQLGRQ